MNRIWGLINNRNWSALTKTVVFMWIFGIVFGMIGLAAWGIVQLWVLETISWMLVFIWYPGIAAALVAFFYCCNNDFNNGAKKREISEYDEAKKDEAVQGGLVRKASNW